MQINLVIYVKEAKIGKPAGVDGCPMEFCKKENMGKILVKLITFTKWGIFLQVGRQTHSI
jgi:hypothetical protein